MKTRRTVRLFVEALENRVTPASAATPTGQLWYSTNWSGYSLDTAPGQVQSVSAEWNVPAVTGSSTGYSAAWVGIDGDNSGSVQQIGTASEVHAVKFGKTTTVEYVYYAWWEMYPANAMQRISSMTVHAGDHIQASVTYLGNEAGTNFDIFELSISDTTSGQSFLIDSSLNGAVQRSSAEWVQEAPSTFFGVLPLANFGSITFTDVKASFNTSGGTVAGSIWDLAPYAQTYSGSSSSINAIDMVTYKGRRATIIAAVSPLNDAGDFAVAFSGTSPNAPAASASAQAGVIGRRFGLTESAPVWIRSDALTSSFVFTNTESGTFVSHSIMAGTQGMFVPTRSAHASGVAPAPLHAETPSGSLPIRNSRGVEADQAVLSHSLGTLDALELPLNDAPLESASVTEALGRDLLLHPMTWENAVSAAGPTSFFANDMPLDRMVISLAMAGLMLYGQNFVKTAEEDLRRSWLPRQV